MVKENKQIQEIEVGTIEITQDKIHNEEPTIPTSVSFQGEETIELWEMLELSNMVRRTLLCELKRLIKLFPKYFVNRRNELILIPKTNLYFSLNNLGTYFDLKCKIISACSRDCCKTSPYKQKWRNDKYQKEVRNKINTFLGVEFNEDEWMLIYTYLGNGCHSDLCKQFVENNFDINVIKMYDGRSKI